MIFVNEEVVQLSGDPLTTVFDLTNIYRALYGRAKEYGMPEEIINEMDTLVKALVKIPEEEMQEFFDSLPRETALTIEDIIQAADNWKETANEPVIATHANTLNFPFNKQNLS